jgi:hypothetical protein
LWLLFKAKALVAISQWSSRRKNNAERACSYLKLTVERKEAVLVWCEQQDDNDIDDDFMSKLRKLSRKAAVKVVKEKKQCKIDQFFQRSQ